MRLAPASTALVLVACGLAAIALFGTRQYGWNPSAFLHMDAAFGEAHGVPPGLVLYRDGGYDGMLYYQVARELPALSRGEELSLDSPYRFQRILLPLLSYGLAFGDDARIPAAMLAVNAAAILGTLAAIIAATKRVSVHALASVLNPAALVGMLYMLTEPLSMFFLALFFARWTSNGRRIDGWGVGALLLSLFARETTLFAIGLLMVWYAWRRQWRPVFLLAIPLACFAAWQGILAVAAGAVPLETGGNMVGFPFSGPFMAIRWAFEDEGLRRAYRLTSLGLLAFVLGVAWVLASDARRAFRERDPSWLVLAGLTAVLFCMHAHIWGVITSIGRVVAPFYPAYALYASSRDTRFLRLLSLFLALLSVAAAVGVAAIRHPFIVS